MPPNVTILMPVYNGVSYLQEAVDSVLGQTYSDFTFLIIDDASTDQSVNLILSYSDNRIRLIRNEKTLGQISTMNKGLQLAEGDYIARMDQDDICLPTRIERQVALLNSNPKVAVAGSWMWLINGEGKRLQVIERELPSYANFMFELLRQRGILAHPSVMLRRNIVVELGGYDPQLPLSEDFDLWTRIAGAGYDAKIVPEPMIYYRVHAEQQSAVQKRIQEESLNKAYNRFLESYLDGFPFEPAMRFLLRKDEFWERVSFFKMTMFVRAMRRMLSNICRKTGMSHQDSIELKHLIAGTAYETALQGVYRSFRLASIPIFFFYLLNSPGSIFSRDCARYCFSLTRLISCIRKIRNSFTGTLP